MPNWAMKFSGASSFLCALSMNLLGAPACRAEASERRLTSRQPVKSRKPELADETPALPGTVLWFSGSKRKFVWGNLFLLLLGGAALSAPVAALSPANLRCEYAVNPLGVDAPNPRLFWTVESSQRGQKQTAYEILAASSPELLPRTRVICGTAARSSDETIQIPYAGRPLKSSQQVFWKVRVWDTNGKGPPGAGRRRGRWAF